MKTICSVPNEVLALLPDRGAYINDELVLHAEGLMQNAHYEGVSPLYIKTRYLECKDGITSVELVLVTENIKPPSIVGAKLFFPDDADLYEMFVDTRGFDDMVKDRIDAKKFKEEAVLAVIE